MSAITVRQVDLFLQDGTPPRTQRPGEWYVRIKPYNPRTGNLLRVLTLSKWQHRIKLDRGWHVIKNPGSEELRDLVAAKNAGDPRYAAQALDVCTWEESLILKREEAEARARQVEVAADPDNAHVLRSKDLPSDRRRRRDGSRHMAERVADEREADAEARAIRKEYREKEVAAMAEAEKDAARERALRMKAEAEAALKLLDGDEKQAAKAAKAEKAAKAKKRAEAEAAAKAAEEAKAAELAKLDAEDEKLMSEADTAPEGGDK